MWRSREVSRAGKLRIAVIGGGPAGLYFAVVAKKLDPERHVEVWERNPPDETFGFGVVFSEETLGGIEHADPTVRRAMKAEFAEWDDIDIHSRDSAITVGGNHFAAMSRHQLNRLLHTRATELGAVVHYLETAPPVEELAATHDLVVAADGVNSGVRTQLAHRFQPSLDARHCRYMWLAAPFAFDAFKFFILETRYGTIQVHAYPYSADRSTVIVEATESTWRRVGLDRNESRIWVPGENDEESIARCNELLRDVLGGQGLLGNNSRWLRFVTVHNRSWVDRNIVLLGDAAHTAHFSIGSGTKLAMEDALALAACLEESPEVGSALAAYEAERRPVVESTQRAAQASLEWFENIDQYVGQEPLQFAFNLMTRSRRVTYANLRLRDPEFVAKVDQWFAQKNLSVGDGIRPPMFMPLRLRGLELTNRVMVSAMDMYSSKDGLIGDFHLVHLGSKALGGAGLVMTEMVCVSREGRITPGCAGLYADEHQRAFARLVDFVHTHTTAKIGIQLGHSGRKGSTRLMWEGQDEPLEDDNWPLMAPSSVPYLAHSQVPRTMTREDMELVKSQFVLATRRAAAAGFDLLELHCAHGYLLASFISPVTNRRRDEYGGSLENRVRYPLEVASVVRSAWPEDRPMSVRTSATDWVEGGLTAEESVDVATAFHLVGVDAVDVSTGQTIPEEQPDFGRSYHTPFADRIRNRTGIATIAVGAISGYDDVNSVILAGRADLCALGRAHLYDPAWTLHAAADQEYAVSWPVQFRRGSRKPPAGRLDAPGPRLDLIRHSPPGTGHRRWRPKVSIAADQVIATPG